MDIDQYWPIAVALISAVWITITLIRTRSQQAIDQSTALLSRQLEHNKYILDYPEAQKFISKNAEQKEEFFQDQTHLDSDDYYRAKTLVYMNLNIFDEVLAFSAKSGKWWNLFKPQAVVELSDWESYIKEMLKHPFYRSILNNEGKIFGKSLQKFWGESRIDIAPERVNQFLW
jgi:hypothetical protein